MSSPVTHGISGLTFGTPPVAGYVVQSVSNSAKAGVVAEVFDENGCRVHSRYDDNTNEVTFDAIIAGATLPTPGSIFTVNSTNYGRFPWIRNGKTKDSFPALSKERIAPISQSSPLTFGGAL